VDGEGIQWYGDEDLVEVLETGNVFTRHRVEVGVDSFYVTQQQDACNSKAALLVFRVSPIPGSPMAIDTSVCEGDESIVLHTEGEWISWYADTTRTNLLFTGNSFICNASEEGRYTYYSTLTLEGCESLPSENILTILGLPQAPDVTDVSICMGEEIPELLARGEGIRWYADAAKELIEATGNSWKPVISEAGTYNYYVTQTFEGCESSVDTVSLTLYPLPWIDLGNDTTLVGTQTLVLGPFEAGIAYRWRDGSTKPYLIFNAGEAGQGDHTVYLEASNDWCTTSDTIQITVKSTVDLAERDVKEFQVYPNPVSNQLHLEAYGIQGKKQVELTDMTGKVLLRTQFEGDSHRLEFQDYPPGYYLLKLESEEKIAIFKLINN
jgi:hypothetical protein